MMAMAKDEPVPTWRNFVAWSLVGAGFTLAVWVGIMFLFGDGLRAPLPSRKLAAILGLTLILGAVVTGLTGRKRPLSLRNFRNYMVLNAAAVVAFLLAIGLFSAASRAGALAAMGASERVAAVAGLVFVALALLGIFFLASARAGAGLIEDEDAADDMRERARLFLYSFVWMALCGLLLIVLGLAGPGGLLSPAAALASALALIAVLLLLGIAARRLNDELGRTLSRETGNIAFHLILALGGGWAMLAHLGFVAAPAPLDWLTMFILLMFVASFIAAARRKLLTR